MRFVLFANTAWYLYNFRLSLAETLREQGHSVVLLSPPDPYGQRLQDAGFEWHPFPLKARRLNPFAELGTVTKLIRTYLTLRPDAVHHFTVKCVLYGSIAAKLTGVRNISNSITGLGYAFTNNNIQTFFIRMFLKLAYGVILHRTKVIFQNTDDLNLFLKNGWVKENQATIIPGSGVDTGRFTPAPKDDPGKIPLVILPARMLWAKGIGEFVEAAHLLRAKGPAIRMALVGDLYSGNPDAIPLESLNRWQQEGSVEWWGWREDMVDVYHQADLVCLPSYHEGLSKTLVEAAACGKAIITTDVPGCRDVVRHGENGLLVPPKNAAALAQAIETLITDPELCANMGARGRQIAEREFAAEKIVAQTLRVYEK